MWSPESDIRVSTESYDAIFAPICDSSMSISTGGEVFYTNPMIIIHIQV